MVIFFVTPLELSKRRAKPFPFKFDGLRQASFLKTVIWNSFYYYVLTKTPFFVVKCLTSSLMKLHMYIHKCEYHSKPHVPFLLSVLSNIFHVLSLKFSLFSKTTIGDKIFGKKLGNQENSEKTRKLVYLILRNFLPLLPNINFLSEDWTVALLHLILRFSFFS